MPAIFTSVNSALRQRFIAWAMRRQKSGGQHATLRHQNIFILPNRNGAMYAAMIVIMLLGSINYGISMGYFLTFLMAGVGSNAMWRTHRNLHQLRVKAGHANPVFAGQSAVFHVELSNANRSARPAIGLKHASWESALITVPSSGHSAIPLEASCPTRGMFKPGRFSLHSEYPLGIFRAWTWIALDMNCIVYPKPMVHPFIGVGGNDKTGQENASRREGNDDFAGLKNHRPGDPPKHTAWKVMAKQEKMLTKHFCGEDQEGRWLDWATLPDFSVEARLSILCHWVLEADARSIHYGLRLPGIELSPQRGTAHKKRCLEALALFDANSAPP